MFNLKERLLWRALAADMWFLNSSTDCKEVCFIRRINVNSEKMLLGCFWIESFMIFAQY